MRATQPSRENNIKKERTCKNTIKQRRTTESADGRAAADSGRSTGTNMTKLTINVAAAAILLAPGMACAQAGEGAKGDAQKRFVELMEADWKEVLHDPCTQDWRKNWTLDGVKAAITNSKDGMDFTAGPKAFNDAHHAVLWTKQDFKGDVKIEYEYTRTDKEIKMVNIIYLQATGSGKPGFDKDISAWAKKRIVPAMKTYFNNMNTYHISYAAFGTKNTIPGKDYIRGRRYMCKGLKGTELDNEYENTGLFAPGIPHKITIIKRERNIYMHIQSGKKEMLCHLINSKFPPITEGKIGLRHMYTRGARYKNFKVSVLAEDNGKADMQSREYRITDLAELTSRIKIAKPGDVLVLPAGTLKDWTVDITSSGTKDAPITIRGQGCDKSVFTGKSAIRLNGVSYVHLKDFGVSDTTGSAVVFNSTRYCSLSHASFTEVKYAPVIKLAGNGQSNQIASCHFFNNPVKNIQISIGGTAPVKTIIRNNLFEDVPPIGGNGRETIQIGQNQPVYGNVEANALVESNRFIRCNGEAEIISNKSSGNRYIGNIFLECEGELVMRGGSGCTIENNRFENCSGGIRLSGKDHIIRNNVIWKSRRFGIRLLYGVSDTPPAFYQAVSGCTIENNTIVDAKGAGIVIGSARGKELLKNPQAKKKLKGNPNRYGTRFEMTVAPYDNTIQRNVVFSQKGDLITTDKAPHNIFKDNLAFSRITKAEADNKYHFAPLVFVDLDGGNLTLKANSEGPAARGARGMVCEPVQLKKPESEISNKRE
jgi:parallel beta-helix repeat protein